MRFVHALWSKGDFCSAQDNSGEKAILCFEKEFQIGPCQSKRMAASTMHCSMLISCAKEKGGRKRSRWEWDEGIKLHARDITGRDVQFASARSDLDAFWATLWAGGKISNEGHSDCVAQSKLWMLWNQNSLAFSSCSSKNMTFPLYVLSRLQNCVTQSKVWKSIEVRICSVIYFYRKIISSLYCAVNVHCKAIVILHVTVASARWLSDLTDGCAEACRRMSVAHAIATFPRSHFPNRLPACLFFSFVLPLQLVGNRLTRGRRGRQPENAGNFKQRIPPESATLSPSSGERCAAMRDTSHTVFLQYV